MKMNPSVIHAAAAVLAGIFSTHAADTAKSPHIDPATGLMSYNNAADPAGAPHIDPLTGLPANRAGGLLGAEDMVNLAFATDNEIRPLILNGRYEEALQRCLAFHNRAKANVSLSFLLSDWVELGRRYPKAKEALVAIRDRDVREFTDGRGYFDLFQELKSINGQYGNDEDTYALFKTIREKDPNLARQCLFCIEGLVAEKEGTPQQRFEVIQRNLERQRDTQQRLAESNRQAAEMRSKRGLTNSWAPPDNSARMKHYSENGFVEQTCHLIESLVATGHRADAEKIRVQSLAILDDTRLKSAASDTTHKPAK
jgi:hypothetical protein